MQYVTWLKAAATGDFGRSWDKGKPVSVLLGERLPHTALLAAVALGMSIVFALPLGAIAAWHRNRWPDHVGRLLALVGASLPNFFVAYVLILVLAVKLSVVPIFDPGTPFAVVVPAASLAIGMSAILSRLTRATVLEVLYEDFVRTAQAKGLRSWQVVRRHVARNVLIPILTVLGLHLGHLLGGAVIVEWIFAWPGIGTLGLDGIHGRDYPLIQGFVFVTGVVFVAVNIVTDLLYGVVDPRVRITKGRI